MSKKHFILFALLYQSASICLILHISVTILLYGKYQNEWVKHLGIHTAGFKPVLDRYFEYLI
jgi:hypothetical protein